MSGTTASIELQLVNAAGINLSARGIVLTVLANDNVTGNFVCAAWNPRAKPGAAARQGDTGRPGSAPPLQPRNLII